MAETINMKAGKLWLAILLFSAASGAVYAQSPATPDLSGTWRLNLGKSRLPKKLKIQSETLVITCSATSIEMRSTVGGQESTHTYIPDGKEKVIKDTPDGEIVAKTKWKGSVLIIEMIARLKVPNNPQLNGTEIIHSKERWSLSADGRVLTEEVGDTKSVYDRLPI